MARTYVTKDGDMLDLICFKHYAGRQSGVVEAVIAANYGTPLLSAGAVLPRGLAIKLPDLPTALSQQPTVKLWD